MVTIMPFSQNEIATVMPARDARPMSCIEGEAARKKSTVNGPMPESGAATNQASWPKGELLSPIEISARIVDWSLAKTRLSLDRLVVLGILGGLYIGFGAALFTLVMSGSSTGL